jgi:hypothetical protein
MGLRYLRNRNIGMPSHEYTHDRPKTQAYRLFATPIKKTDHFLGWSVGSRLAIEFGADFFHQI